MSKPGIEIEQRGRVLLARITGGPRGEIAADLAALVIRADTDDGVGAVVLTGTHPTRFLAHAEVGWGRRWGRPARRSSRGPPRRSCTPPASAGALRSRGP